MDNWAIVIGIDKYWINSACLKGAVRDAFNMRDWLINPLGGQVRPGNLILLLGVLNQTQLPPGIQFLDATRDNIVLAIENIIDRSGGEGDRLFFYFSGHGLSARRDYSFSNGIIPTDFTNRLTNKAITLESIFERFQATRFKEQFFFIDACRNIPWDSPFRISDLDRPGEITPPFPPQYIMYATSSGLKATETNWIGNELGAFTEALLQGLKGDGAAKVFDDDIQEYIVRWGALFKYIETVVKKKKIEVGDQNIQEPRQAGEHGGDEPILARFSLGSFPQEELSVNVLPIELALQTEVIVRNPDEEVSRKSGLDKLPYKIMLDPRIYTIKAKAPTYRSIKSYYMVELYDNKNLEITFVPGEEKSPSSEFSSGFDDDLMTKGFSEDKSTEMLELRSSDVLASISLLDSSGRKILKTGMGSLFVTPIKPGYYRARISTPEGNFSEELFEVMLGKKVELDLSAPTFQGSPLLNQILESARIQIEPDQTIIPDKVIGPTSTIQLSTLLTLAGGMVNEGYTSKESRLNKIGVSSLKEWIGSDVSSGVQILFGIETESKDQTKAFIEKIFLACWNQNDPVPHHFQKPNVNKVLDGLAEYAWEKTPGNYWLSIKTPDQKPIAFSIAVLPNRVTIVVFIRSISGKVELYQYMPSVITGDPPDFRSKITCFPILQRSELIQRNFINNKFHLPDPSEEEFLLAKCYEPVANILSGFRLFRIDPHHELLERSMSIMTSLFGAFSDLNVLKGIFLDKKSKDIYSTEISNSYNLALETGLPILSFALDYLLNGTKKKKVDHLNIKKYDYINSRKVNGIIWLAVPVDELKKFN